MERAERFPRRTDTQMMPTGEPFAPAGDAQGRRGNLSVGRVPQRRGNLLGPIMVSSKGSPVGPAPTGEPFKRFHRRRDTKGSPVEAAGKGFPVAPPAPTGEPFVLAATGEPFTPVPPRARKGSPVGALYVGRGEGQPPVDTLDSLHAGSTMTSIGPTGEPFSFPEKVPPPARLAQSGNPADGGTFFRGAERFPRQGCITQGRRGNLLKRFPRRRRKTQGRRGNLSKVPPSARLGR